MNPKRITIIPFIHGKLTRDGKMSEPDIRWIMEKWLERHPELKNRTQDNLLHDKSQTPYMRSTDIDHYLGTNPSSGAAKLAAIRKMLKVHQLDPSWTLPSRLDDNPLVWTLQVNGCMMDVRHASREVQEIAFNKGLIPYIPADRQHGG